MATPGKSRGMRVIEPLAAPVWRFEWQLAKVREVVVETFPVRSLLLHARGRWEHLTSNSISGSLAEDGYQAQRSNPIASHSGCRISIHVVRATDDLV